MKKPEMTIDSTLIQSLTLSDSSPPSDQANPTATAPETIVEERKSTSPSPAEPYRGYPAEGDIDNKQEELAMEITSEPTLAPKKLADVFGKPTEAVAGGDDEASQLAIQTHWDDSSDEETVVQRIYPFNSKVLG